MTIRIGINGFGRIGRITLRQLKNNPGVVCVGINDIAPVKTLAHLFKYDSTHGRYSGSVTAKENAIVIDGREIPIFNSKDPSQIPWKNVGADIIFECTGRFTTKAEAGAHLKAGAKKVIISAPATDPDATFVYGVNHKTYNPETHTIISNASCTTNCLAPLAYVLHKNFGLEKGFMTTIHSYTNDQMILDAPHKDLRRARSGAANQIPTSTGAAKAVGLVLPELAGKLDGFSMRVPTVNVSCTDLVALLKKEVKAEEVTKALQEAADGELKNILGVEMDPLVSSDFLGDTRSSIIDGLSTKAMGNLVKVIAWYDNETGFSCRMIDLAKYIGERLS
ncbi:MAG: type I glyceraldehyde-3-phosphate dehydrogenase [Deltaproteobacteria bacterium]|nr:type I glyceraldehyde-3-phosphate dehydrogenase [Deltaproteobacteria bacterium]